MKGEEQLLVRLSAFDRSEVGVPQPAWAEIVYGVERLPNSKRKDLLREKFELLRSELTTVEWSDATTEQFGRIKATLEKKGQRIEDSDAAIAAHALERKAILITGNLKQMLRVPGLAAEHWGRSERR